MRKTHRRVVKRRRHRTRISSRRRLFLMTQMKEARADRRGRPLVPASFCDGYVPALLSLRAGCHSDDEWLPSASAAAVVGCDSHAGQKPACVSLPPLLQTLTQLPPLPVTPPLQMIIRSLLLLLRLLLFYEPVRRSVLSRHVSFLTSLPLLTCVMLQK